MNRFQQTLSLCLLAWAAAVHSAWSQEARATLGGRVTDPQGAVVPGAAVTVTADATGVEQRTRTNELGNWAVQFLVPGGYSFSIKAPGFQGLDQKGVVLRTADNKLIDTQLTIGAATEQVTVTAETPLIDTTSASSGTVITREEILEMPSSSRESTLLATLSPGVLQQDQNNNPIHLWSYLAGSQMTIDGGRNNTRSNEFELDGMPNVKSGGNVGFMPPPDAISEFRVQMNAYDASIGRQAGGTIQMSIRSGGAQYHGNLYEFNQNNLLNANLFQTNLQGGAKPPIHQNEYGGTLGGPVWIPKVYNGRQKTFFFVSYTRFKDSEPRYSIRSVPTALERQGDFSQSFTTQTINGQRVRYPDPGLRSAERQRERRPSAFSRHGDPCHTPERDRAENPVLRGAAEHDQRSYRQRYQQLHPGSVATRYYAHPDDALRPELERRAQELRQFALLPRDRDRLQRLPQRGHRQRGTADLKRYWPRSRMDDESVAGARSAFQPDQV
jgi:hypothetical protein